MDVAQAPDQRVDQAEEGVDRPASRRVSPARRRRATIEELRAELATGRLATTIPTEPALGALFTGPGLRKGAVYSVAGGAPASASLLLALLAGPSRAGLWCGVVGLPGLGIEAAAGFGVDLRRLVLVPAAGSRWLEAVGALADVLDVVVVRPETEVHDSQARRLAARLRERGTVLIVAGTPGSSGFDRSPEAGPSPGSGRASGRSGSSWGTRPGPPLPVQQERAPAPARGRFRQPEWPGCELRFDVTASDWTGLGCGHGHLAARRVTVEAIGRGAPHGRSVDLWLPDRHGAVSVLAGESRTGEPYGEARSGEREPPDIGAQGVGEGVGARVPAEQGAAEPGAAQLRESAGRRRVGHRPGSHWSRRRRTHVEQAGAAADEHRGGGDPEHDARVVVPLAADAHAGSRPESRPESRPGSEPRAS